jgi:hypothetical protein
MNLRILVLLALFGVSFSCHAVLVKMPSAKILAERLEEMHLGYFAQKTNIVEDLAGQEKEAIAVVVALNVAFLSYSKVLRENPHAGMLEFQVNLLKLDLLNTLLQDFPDAIEELKSSGLYK